MVLPFFQRGKWEFSKSFPSKKTNISAMCCTWKALFLHQTLAPAVEIAKMQIIVISLSTVQRMDKFLWLCAFCEDMRKTKGERENKLKTGAFNMPFAIIASQNCFSVFEMRNFRGKSPKQLPQQKMCHLKHKIVQQKSEGKKLKATFEDWRRDMMIECRLELDDIVWENECNCAKLGEEKRYKREMY